MVELNGGRHSLEAALDEYETAWQNFIKVNNLNEWASAIKTNTISWKVADKATLFENLEQLADLTEQVHIGTVNNRFIASIVLHEPTWQSVKIIKILERRAGSADSLGLDSIDFLVSNTEEAFKALQKVKGGEIQKENNDMHAWLSLRFGENEEFEAKLVDHTVLAVAIKELKLAIKNL